MKKWTGSFNEGMALLRRHGIAPSRVLLQAEQLPYVPPAAMQELVAKIALLPDDATAAVQVVTMQHVTAPSTQHEPPEVLRLRDKGKRLLKQQAMLHAQLCAATDDQQRYAIARELMEEVIPEIDQVYDVIRTYEKEGELPMTGKDEIVKDTIKKMYRIETLRTRISRLRTALNSNISQTDRSRYEKELVLKEIEMSELRSELGIE